MIRLLFLISMFSSFHHLKAHPTSMGTITGEHIALQTINHSFAGSIKNRIVMGRKLPGQFVSELKVLDHDHESITLFKSNESNTFEGILSVQSPHSSSSIHIEFVKLVKEESKYILRIDDNLVEVHVTADDFTDGHFINPEYKMEYEGEIYRFKLDGQACYGYSLHLITMIMGASIV